ncbi:MAG: M24 family metallopeptidase, partial [Candidatus Binatia bacterium]|nr:M24 family metallopeptidase [Candidatus Binatia bacterium]
MASKLTFGPSISDWQERINVERMNRERSEKALETLRKHNIPTLLAARPENTRYLTGLRGPEFVPQLWYVLFFAEHDPVVFHHAGWIHMYPSQAPWIKHWRLARSWLNRGCGSDATVEEARLFADGIHRELEDRGLQNEPLGVMGFDGPAQQALTVKGIKTVDGWPLMLEATKTKTVDEINCLKMAFSATDAAWNKAWELLKPGAIDVEVSRRSLMAAYDSGADEVPPGYFRSGPTSFDRAYENTQRMFNYGDLAYAAFCGVGYLGYKTCYYRTFSIGRQPETHVKDWYRTLVERLDRVIDAIKPGATTADAARHFPPASQWGYTEEAELLTLEIGHGIGLHHYGYPIINRQWSPDHPQVFEAGMTIAIEGREGEPNMGGVRLEDAVVVTENGAELIDHWPRQEILVAPR